MSKLLLVSSICDVKVNGFMFIINLFLLCLIVDVWYLCASKNAIFVGFLRASTVVLIWCALTAETGKRSCISFL